MKQCHCFDETHGANNQTVCFNLGGKKSCIKNTVVCGLLCKTYICRKFLKSWCKKVQQEVIVRKGKCFCCCYQQVSSYDVLNARSVGWLVGSDGQRLMRLLYLVFLLFSGKHNGKWKSCAE